MSKALFFQFTFEFIFICGFLLGTDKPGSCHTVRVRCISGHDLYHSRYWKWSPDRRGVVFDLRHYSDRHQRLG